MEWTAKSIHEISNAPYIIVTSHWLFFLFICFYFLRWNLLRIVLSFVVEMRFVSIEFEVPMHIHTIISLRKENGEKIDDFARPFLTLHIGCMCLYIMYLYLNLPISIFLSHIKSIKLTLKSKNNRRKICLNLNFSNANQICPYRKYARQKPSSVVVLFIIFFLIIKSLSEIFIYFHYNLHIRI